jgi:hypothetical protein
MLVQQHPDHVQAEEAGCANDLTADTWSHKRSNSSNNNNTSNKHFMPEGKRKL